MVPPDCRSACNWAARSCLGRYAAAAALELVLTRLLSRSRPSAGPPSSGCTAASSWLDPLRPLHAPLDCCPSIRHGADAAAATRCRHPRNAGGEDHKTGSLYPYDPYDRLIKWVAGACLFFRLALLLASDFERKLSLSQQPMQRGAEPCSLLWPGPARCVLAAPCWAGLCCTLFRQSAEKMRLSLLWS